MQAHTIPLLSTQLPQSNTSIPTSAQPPNPKHQTHNSETSLNAAINLLNLNTRTVPLTPTNSMATTNPTLNDVYNAKNIEAAFLFEPNSPVQNQLGDTTRTTGISTRSP